jgi:hypothetical protein
MLPGSVGMSIASREDSSPDSVAPPSGNPSSGVRTSSGPLRVERVCKSCGVGLKGKRRTKNVDGDYRCLPCHERRKVVRAAYYGVRRQAKRLGAAGVVVVAMAMALVGAMRTCSEPVLSPADSR